MHQAFYLRRLTMELNQKQIAQLQKAGISKDYLSAQKHMLLKGARGIELDRAASIGDGIHALSEREQEVMIQLFEATAPEWKIIRFVPASGAATRMFKHLIAKDEPAQSVFLEGLDKMAISEDIPKEILSGEGDTKVDYVLNDLQLQKLPKALIKFHWSPEGSHTALEEHFEEMVELLGDFQENLILHFTVSPEHLELFRAEAQKLAEKYGTKGELNFILEYSEQSSATQSIAIDETGEVVQENGELLLRPGGHGALIHNLYAMVADIAFIKNIDNVVPKEKLKPSIRWKKILGGKLFDLRIKVFQYLIALDEGRMPYGMDTFLLEEFGLKCPESVDDIKTLLNRPIRVCGMVKNEGEPGGGPFWVRGKDGIVSLQIVEKSQVDASDEEAMEKLKNSTHFNPVDLVCSLRNYEGRKFRLLDFVDPQSFFVSQKSHEGKNIRAFELPGLWNGAMAHWLTSFIEVPIETFNPVKSVNDLLKEGHQS